MRKVFDSPWSLGLKVLTGAVLLILLAAVVVRQDLLTVGVAIVVVAVCGLFAVRGYTIDGRTLLVHRVGWSNRYDLARLRDVEVARTAMHRSLRVFGTGGLFAYTGIFRNAKIGWYRAYATDPQRSVVLRFDQRNIVVTPDDPQAFSEAIRSSAEPLSRGPR